MGTCVLPVKSTKYVEANLGPATIPTTLGHTPD